MKTQIFPTLLLLLGLVICGACKKEKVSLTTPPPGLGGDSTGTTPTDVFIHDSLTIPYNIAVYYKWTPGQLDFPYDMVPPIASKVTPSLKALLAVVFRPYNDQTGSTGFMRGYFPKTIKLAGSAEFQSNGSIILGQAEGGTEMLLYMLNYFTAAAKDSAILKQMGHTMHHEFGHILNQNILVPPTFKQITPHYTGNWYNVADQDARQNGFITAYAESDPKEDFVEMVATMLIGAQNGLSGFDDYEKIMAEQTGGPGSASYIALRAKEAAVVDYYARSWHIDFYALQARCRRALTAFYQ
ncbi:substrate import-associated zinc metallohydrolase lipoprotein [Chitinophaga sp. 212800010-3]|jgi:substrate import-associated zinc metallohydrolase lipoprotein|uniref:substrate import-associated zinc metallohydrolase lipoprotein n=1 Tax=unclassified Chitinophaga TaxID=2619133 RepID=UPI002DED0E49|nr:Substrate import-associated zinc metallohydrolase lipoprotein [Chitinophaga sp. 212800010-3]